VRSKNDVSSTIRRELTRRQPSICENSCAGCTKIRHGPVNGLHSIDSAEDKDALFSLTISLKSVKTTSFFDTFRSFSGWCSVRGSSEITFWLKDRKEGQQGSISKALVEENRSCSRRQDRVPKALGWFVRLAVSPEPESRSRVATRKEATRAGRRGSNASYWPRRMRPTSPRDS
jgi:hypothetical protein